MNIELHNFLKACDVRGAWETPPGADWHEAIARIHNVKPDLESLLGTKLHLDDGVQDASFFADIGFLMRQSADNGSVVLSYQICVRFSWFANMVTVFGERMQDFDIESLKQLLKDCGYVYVPAEELDEPYDGVNEPYENGLTWWTRYFDYL